MHQLVCDSPVSGLRTVSTLALSAEACFLFLGRQAPSPLVTLVQASCESGPRQILLLNLETGRSTSIALVSQHAARRRTTVYACQAMVNLLHGPA